MDYLDNFIILLSSVNYLTKVITETSMRCHVTKRLIKNVKEAIL